ncbi:MAG: carbon starvation CstA family protein [bacterium]|jgi:carbon starvation protein|nr:carbon starvation CstA family protein [bacterium]
MQINIAAPLLLGLIVFYLGYKYYGRLLSSIFGENDDNITPAVELKDDVDYVPTPLGVAFSHHFASIAGAGPIIGPVAALIFGYAPVWGWIILGTVFFGAVHDYTALFVSMREKGRSVADVANSYLGRFGFFLFISFTIIMIVLVTSAFLGLTAVSLTSMVPLKHIAPNGDLSLLKTISINGVPSAKIGGIASTSVIIITFFAPLIGWLLYIKKIKVWIASIAAIIICTLSIITGLLFPLSLDPQLWMVILSVYVIIAAGMPVWLILQPRDFMNSFILYTGIAMLLLGVIGGGFGGLTLHAPAFNLARGNAELGLIWPFLFITVACGAISGFHALVAGGTVAKQAERESHARKIGFGAMILEGIMALVVLMTIAGGLKFDAYMSIVYPLQGKSNPILAFALAMGTLLHNAIRMPIALGTVFGILMVEGFVITTLDTAVRLNRYLFEELWTILFTRVPRIMKSYLFNSLLSAALMLWLAKTNAFMVIWPIFGTANQLLAALTLIAVSVWLAYRGKPTLITLIPAAFMMITTLASLYMLLINNYLPAHNKPLIAADLLLMLLSIGVIYIAAKRLAGIVVKRKRAVSAA